MNLRSSENLFFYGLWFFALISCVSMTAQNVVAMLLLICFALKLIRERQWPLPADELIAGIALFFGAAAISGLFALNKQASLAFWFNYLFRFTIFFVTVCFVQTRKQVQGILLALAISMAIADLAAIWQWLHGVSRVSGFFGHPMMLAGCLMIMLPVLFVQALHKQRHRIVFIFALIISLFTLVINQTRGAWIAAGITAVVAGMLLRQYRKKIFFSTLGLLIFLVFLFSVTPQLAARFQTLFDMQYESNSERVLVWHSAIQMFKDYPVTGIGLGNFPAQYVTKYMSPLAKEKLGHAHNNVLQVLAETGIIGGMAFLYMFYVIFKRYYRHISSADPWKSNLAIMGFLGAAALFLQGLTEYNFAHAVVIRLFWFVLGVICAAMQMHEEG